MKTALQYAFVFFVLALMEVSASFAHAAIEHSPRSDLKAFYKWYLPEVLRNRRAPAWASTIRRRAPVLSARLQSKLAIDLRRRNRFVGEVNGIDFEPFLGGQDPCSRVFVGKAAPRGRRYVLEVRALCDAETRSEPIRVLMVAVGPRFVIDDVDYGVTGTLIQALDAR